MAKVNLRDIHQPIAFKGGHETVSFNAVVRRLDGIDFELNIDPDYQRGHVWTDAQAAAFVGHMLEGGAIPMIIVNRADSYSSSQPDEVIDGKQRLTAVYRFMKGEIPAELTDGRKVWLSDFEEPERLGSMVVGPHFTFGYVQLSRPEVLRLYLRLNRGGTIHTDAEINRVRDLLAAEDGGSNGPSAAS